ncbi:YgaP family membrane protein [Corynebacterium sp. ZY180755]
MGKNESLLDRGIRVVIAAVAVVLGVYVLSGVWSVVAYIVAAVMAVTAIAGICPLYKVFGVNTCKS